jgi:ribosomal protein S18 acetylase RimI-like enzyme
VPLKIRPATREDATVLATLNAIVHDLHASRRPDSFRTPSASEVADWFAHLLAEPTARAWIADYDGAPVGYVLALLNDRPANVFCHARHWCEIDQISVAPTHRKRGIARALVEHAVAAARSAGFHDVELSTWSFNHAAQRAFEQIGFVPKTIRYELKPRHLS